jgi:DMSO/TMAO reductase YedYZ molybdopterin-dependent catalytic subunit
VQAVRDAIRLPAAASTAPPVPGGAELGIDGLDAYVTPNETFYRIDTALRVPQVDPRDWSLTVTGLVDEPFTLTWDDLLALPLQEHHVTLACVSNAVGGNLIGNALWLGYPVRELLARARPRAGADMVLSRSTDGFTAGTPLEVLLEDDRQCLLAIGMNGEPLPPEHGFPARLVVPGLYGYVSATKWVTELKVTRFADDEAYWTPRGWSALGPIKLSSRIDVPRPGDDLPTGTVTVAGVAWAQHTGISRVEVRVDGGAWVAAELADTVGPDTWRQWRYDWDAAPGEHVVAVRATDADGVVQVEAEAPPAPDGATGWHTIPLTIG